MKAKSRPMEVMRHEYFVVEPVTATSLVIRPALSDEIKAFKFPLKRDDVIMSITIICHYKDGNSASMHFSIPVQDGIDYNVINDVVLQYLETIAQGGENITGNTYNLN